ncbi:MAG: PD40 domain-containing protein [Candidatus Eisenbacteria bacterium]|nr:PD40 domain-containing protein [Candidatus Eisenbacteria bacterium]
MLRRSLFVLFALVASAAPALALEECRLMRMPDIQGDRIVFVYAGDLWTVARAGGTAQRLTTHEGVEAFPKFSPDGQTVAFTGEYDGNTDVFTVPTVGGEPLRLSYHPGADMVAEWYPDGKSILIRSMRASSIQRFTRFFKVPATGGFEEMLALPTAGYASLSADAKLIAYVSPSYDNRTWKRYRGGNAPNILVYDFARNTSENVTKDWDGPDEWPMFHGRTLYYCSDRGGRTANVWAYDLDKKTQRQVTRFTEYDVKWPSIGSDAIVFENGGWLYVMDLPSEKLTKLSVKVPDDKPATRAEYRRVGDWLTGMDLSPSAKRAVLEARGELFSVPAEKGDVRNLTNTPGARERNPAWSPDGRWIAYLSDATGEYQWYVLGADGKTPPRQVTKEGATFRYGPQWSPDSKKLAFSDKTGRLWLTDVASGKLTQMDKSEYGELFQYGWSKDSKWVCYMKPSPAGFGTLQLYSLESGRVTPVTDGLTDDFSPSFDPEGRYLYFISRRTLTPQFGTFELDMHFTATDKLYAMSLQDSLLSPVAPESDEEPGEAAKSDDKAKGKDDKGAKAKEEKAADPGMRIDLAGLGSRVAELPVPAGRYTALTATKGKVVYLSFDETPDEDGQAPCSLHYFDLDKREDKTVLSGVDAGYSLSKDGEKVLYRKDDQVGIVDVAPDKKAGDGKLATDQLMALVDPRQEWMQMFNEAWRLERDFYYDPGMGGLDWKAIGDRYRQLVPYVAHRSDLNYILGELIGELSTSHTYVGGGDMPRVPRVGVGLLGADFSFDAGTGLYRFAKVYRGRDWNSRVDAPLGEPGIGVKDGDLLLEVNGRPLRAPENVYSAFIGTVGKQTTIKVGASANDPKARTYTVEPIGNEASLRYVDWVRANYDKVQAATGGRIGYIHVPNTAIEGMQEFTKGYYPQVHKDGMIVDERFNGGGFIPDFFVEKLMQSTWTYWSNRDMAPFRTPQTSVDGPKCILANEYAGSGGDAFPYYFKLKGVGPIIGKRTWGGLVGISHSLPLVDGGVVTMPDFGVYSTEGRWMIENHGVDPDFEVDNTPEAMVSGHDPQLEKAIEWSLEQLKAHPVVRPERPAYKKQQF